MLINIPFGKGFEACEIDDDRIKAHLEPSWPTPIACSGSQISNALLHPIGKQNLRDLASKVKNIVILTSDNTRPVPSKEILPPLIGEIRKGSTNASIRLLIATGLHEWSPGRTELEEKFGPALQEFEQTEIHHARDADSMVQLSSLSTGNDLFVNRLISEGQLIIAEGYIEGHFFAGFTGGPKSVLPGVSGVETIMRNHSPANIDHPKARCGVAEGNPIYEEMCEAANRVGLGFIVNVVLNKEKQVVSAFAGDPIQSHREGRAFSLNCCKVTAVPSDIVITSNGGYPLDRNLYQLVKGISNGALTAKNGGVIVACGECVDGVGPEGFYRMLAHSNTPSDFLRKLRAGEIWEEAQWEAQILAKVLEQFHVVVVSKGVNASTVKSMHMVHARTLKEGIEEALNMRPRGSIALVPDGPSTIPFLETE